MQTIETIVEKLASRGKEITGPGIYRHLKALGIKPLGARQRPQIYPDGSAERILKHLGLDRGAALPNPGADDEILSLEEIKQRAKWGVISAVEIERREIAARKNRKTKKGSKI